VSRLLIDENLSPTLAARLGSAGHDAVHVNAVGLRGADDRAIMTWAARQGRAVVTADRDFHDHLSRRADTRPSVIRVSQRGPDALIAAAAQAARLAGLLPVLAPDLAEGLAVTVGRVALRVDPLPLVRRQERRTVVGHPRAVPRDTAGPAVPGLGRARELPGGQAGGRGR